MKLDAKRYTRFFTFMALGTGLLITGCSRVEDLFDSDDKAPLKGERISVLELQSALEPDNTTLETQGLVTPAPWRNEFWPQPGGYPNHSMQNLELSNAALKPAWSVDIGEGSSDDLPLTAQPIVVDGRIFTLDAQSELSAFNAKTGKLLWRTDVRDLSEDDAVISGGIAFSNGLIYVTNGYNELLAVKPADGKIHWRKRIAAPARAAPTIMGERVFITTLDNRLLALNAADGSLLWEYTGLSEAAALVGAASPAASNDVVLPVFSSGEISALRVENGSVAWTDNLANIRPTGGLATLADIKALPVLDKGLVIAISFSGRLAAIEERTGNRIWQREIGGSDTPWVAGNHLFVITLENELVALGRDTGAIRWVTKLPRFENPERRRDEIAWTGPLLAGGRLLAFSSNGLMAELDPENGKVLRQTEIDRAVRISPVIAGGMLYVLSEDGTLTAYK